MGRASGVPVVTPVRAVERERLGQAATERDRRSPPDCLCDSVVVGVEVADVDRLLFRGPLDVLYTARAGQPDAGTPGRTPARSAPLRAGRPLPRRSRRPADRRQN